MNRVRNRSRGGAGAYQYLAATSTLLARMSVQPSATEAQRIDRLMRKLKSGPTSGTDILASMDQFHCYVMPTSQAALLNWAGSDTAALSGTAPTFTANAGFATNGTSSYIDWGWAPADGVNFLQDDCSMGVWISKTTTNSTAVIGTGTAAVTFVQPRNASNIAVGRLNQTNGTNNTTVVSNGSGLTSIRRADSAGVFTYRQGVPFGGKLTTDSVSTTRSAVDINCGRFNSGFVSATYYFDFAGGNLSDAEMLDLHNAMADYLIEVGLLTTSTMPVVYQNITGTAFALPDGAVPPATTGKGMPCTGLARASDGTFWIGNGLASMEGTECIAHVSADYSTVILQVTAASLGLPDCSVQGVAIEDDGTIAFIAKDTATPQAILVRMDPDDGSLISSTVLTGNSGANGLAIDTTRNRYIISNASNIRWFTMDTITHDASLPTHTISDIDHLSYYADRDLVLYSTGANGSIGNIVSVVATAGRRNFLIRLNLALTIEGVAYDGAKLYTNNDGWTHIDGTVDLNQIQEAATTLIAA